MSTQPDGTSGARDGAAPQAPAAPAPWASPAPTQPAPPLVSWQKPTDQQVSWQQPPAAPAPGAAAWGQPQQPGWGAAPPGGHGPGGQRPTGYPPPGAEAWRRVAVKPGIVALRPLGLGEIYDGAFQAMRRNPRTMLGASAVVNVITTAVGMLILVLTTGSIGSLLENLTAPGGGSVDDSEIAGAVGSAGLGVLGYAVVTGFGTALLTGVLTFAVGRAVLGEKLGPARLWRMVRPRLIAIIVLQLLFGLVYVLLAAATLGPGIGLLFVEPAVGGVLIALGALALLAGGVLVLVVSSMATPALLLEDASVWRAFVRGWRIVRMAFWRTTGTMLLTAVLAYVLSVALAAPSSLLNFLFTALNADDPRAVAGLHPVQLAVSGLFTSVSATIVLPFLAGVATLLYIDVRMRREGLDVELAGAAAR